jgi:enoyl-CoA hydratase/carnithine racemase
MAEGLQVERRGSLVIFTIDRSARRNALDAATSLALDAAVDAAEADSFIRVMLLTATGDQAFCSGMDLKEAAEGGAGLGLILGRGFGGLTERRRRKPLIVAVNGTAVAGGFEIMLSADIVVVADHALLGLPEIKRGLVAFAGGVQRLARTVPRATALGLILTGEPITAQRALELGLVTEVVPSADLMPRAIAIAQVLLGYDPGILERAKLLHDLSTTAPIDESLRFGRAWGEEMLASAAAREGIGAYAEGRKAEFDGG